jgi:hypothetical protein
VAAEGEVVSARPTVPEAYTRTLGVSAQHKVRALSLLAEGGEEATRTAVTLLHEAWRAERRALRVLEAPSPETRLRAAVEACGCLVDARDPSLVLDPAWGEVLDASTAVSAAAAASIRRRLDPKVNALIREYSEAADRAPELFRLLADEAAWRTPRAVRETARRQAEQMVQTFPGDPRAWRSLSFTCWLTNRPQDAWRTIRRAREIDPDDNVAAGAEVNLARVVLPPEEARAFITAAASAAMHGALDLHLGLPLLGALMAYAEGADDASGWWERTSDLASLCLTLPALHDDERKRFRLALLIARERLAGRKPTIDLLFRVGLGAAVPHIPPSEREDVVRAFRSLDRRAWWGDAAA